MKRATFAVLLAAAISMAGSTLLADNYPKNRSIDVLNYVFRLQLRDDTDEIVGETTVDLRFLVDGIRDFQLDLIAAPTDAEGRGMRVSAVSSDGEPLTFSHRDNRLRIMLPAPSSAAQRSRYIIRYRGVPATGLIIGDNKHGERTFFSDNWPNKARNWLPTIDHPYDKARCEFIVTAPGHYQVVSNGLLVEETDLPGDLRLTHWKQSVPIAPWLFALGVARFAVQYVDQYQSKSIQTWVYARDRDAGFYDFAALPKRVLEFFGGRIGPYAYEKLANIQSNSVRGGMEAATAIFYGADSVTGTRSPRWRNVIIHEIAHQWFGNAVTEEDWDDVWLSEGFATYFTLLYIEYAYGHDAFVDGLENSRERVVAFYRDHPDYRIVHDNLADMSQVTSSNTYQKGGWTLHMLRGIVGEESFWAGIRDYYQRYRNGNASTDDFRRAMEEASGMDLSWFFRQWLYQGGTLEIEGVWRYDGRKKQLHVTLNQVQDDGSFFRMPMQLGIHLDGVRRPRIELLQVNELRNFFSIPLERAPVAVELDPDSWVLMQAEFRRGS
ncbi:MAG: M1 family metallopeptidase [Acidobacteriota bacterium]